MKPQTRYLIIERETLDRLGRHATYTVYGVVKTWDTYERRTLKTYRTFRGADAYRRRLLSTHLTLVVAA